MIGCLLLSVLLEICPLLDESLCFFRVIQWIVAAGAPVAAPAAAPAASSSSSSSNRTLSSDDFRYSDGDARRFKAERDDSRRELEVISKQAGIADLEWQHERKQLLEVIDGESCNLLNFNLVLQMILICYPLVTLQRVMLNLTD